MVKRTRIKIHMDTNPSVPPVNPPESVRGVSTLDTSTHRVFGVPRRVIAFGFVLFLMLVVLAVVYSQFINTSGTPVNTKMMETSVPTPMKPSSEMQTTTGPVTPETVTDDLIDDAISDRDDLSGYDSDEMSDIEDGSNY